MMKWRPALYEDLFHVELQPIQKQDDVRHLVADTQDVRDVLAAYARSLVDDGRVLAVVGLWPVFPGMATAWALLSDEALAHPLVLHRGTTRLLEEAIATRGLHRIQATALATFEQGCRWLERLGFEQEGLMRRYGIDQADHYLYARVN